ncbi:MAG: pyridoxal phosphate-dependent aminotransferase [Solobacterium sp.]|jgi:aminotransferase|nr:pyridoxal phosphate-dependent aminotransferase [Solobacterium sp.]
MNGEEYLSDSVSKVAKSLLWEFFDLARKTPNVISLSVGEPDFETPWHISEECIYAIKKGRTYYAPTRGLQQLREGILSYYARRFGVRDYTLDNCLVTVGASESIDLITRAVLNPGDECIVIDPGYVAYEPAVLLTGAKPVYLQLKESEGFKVTPENLLPCISEHTKMIILNYPSNPTGGVMNHEDYEKIIPILKEHHILTVCDEIYLELTYDQKPVSIGSFEEIRDQLVLVNGFSKAYSMTGWRLGYMLAPSAIITACNNIHQYSTMGPMTPAQFAAIEAISNKSDKDIQKHFDSFKIRRNFLVAQLNKIGLHTSMPEGAFYVFANITPSGLKSYDFCAKLLEEQNVCVIPGTAFGPSGEGYVRISYAYSLDQLKPAVERIGEFMKVHHI